VLETRAEARHSGITPVQIPLLFSAQTSAAQPYTTATLTLSDAHGGDNQCSAKVMPATAAPTMLMYGHCMPLAC
jgi:hypothetical protein